MSPPRLLSKVELAQLKDLAGMAQCLSLVQVQALFSHIDAQQAKLARQSEALQVLHGDLEGIKADRIELHARLGREQDAVEAVLEIAVRQGASWASMDAAVRRARGTEKS